MTAAYIDAAIFLSRRHSADDTAAPPSPAVCDATRFMSCGWRERRYIVAWQAVLVRLQTSQRRGESRLRFEKIGIRPRRPCSISKRRKCRYFAPARVDFSLFDAIKR